MSAKSEKEPDRVWVGLYDVLRRTTIHKRPDFGRGKTLVLPYYKITLLEISSVFSSMAPILPVVLAGFESRPFFGVFVQTWTTYLILLSVAH